MSNSVRRVSEPASMRGADRLACGLTVLLHGCVEPIAAPGKAAHAGTVSQTAGGVEAGEPLATSSYVVCGYQPRLELQPGAARGYWSTLATDLNDWLGERNTELRGDAGLGSGNGEGWLRLGDCEPLVACPDLFSVRCKQSGGPSPGFPALASWWWCVAGKAEPVSIAQLCDDNSLCFQRVLAGLGRRLGVEITPGSDASSLDLGVHTDGIEVAVRAPGGSREGLQSALIRFPEWAALFEQARGFERLRARAESCVAE